MSNVLFERQREKFLACLTEWEKIDKQVFLLTNAGHGLIVYPVTPNSFDYHSYAYYCASMLFFINAFVKAVMESLEHLMVGDSDDDSKRWNLLR